MAKAKTIMKTTGVLRVKLDGRNQLRWEFLPSSPRAAEKRVSKLLRKRNK